MKKTFIICILILSYGIGIAQEKRDKKINYHKVYKSLAREEINQLKNGALIVRLKTMKNSIEALKKIKKVEQALDLELKQKKFNLSVISAFKNNFNFCPTYFFFSDSSNNVRDKKFENVIFLDDSLHSDTSIKFIYKSFLTAEFDIIDQDTTIFSTHFGSQYNAQSGTDIKNYYGGPNLNFNALIIKSDVFIQLRQPFPYYVKTYDLYPKKEKLDNVVKVMNKNLMDFFKSVNH